mmetsp:Transcript_22793/g.52886  ORF Transcript_22793/g.52886 Transcript_22793/m.52886 type:complete len:231 (-) Transcript_22793:427-1119(-)
MQVRPCTLQAERRLRVAGRVREERHEKKKNERGQLHELKRLPLIAATLPPLSLTTHVVLIYTESWASGPHTGAANATKEHVEDVFRVNVVRVRVLSPPHTTPATRRSVVAARRIINPVRVVVRPLFRIRERTVRHAHHLERILRTRRRVLIRVQFERELLIRPLNLVLARSPIHIEHLVVARPLVLRLLTNLFGQLVLRRCECALRCRRRLRRRPRRAIRPPRWCSAAGA